jgi:hypothetical protein
MRHGVQLCMMRVSSRLWCLSIPFVLSVVPIRLAPAAGMVRTAAPFIGVNMHPLQPRYALYSPSRTLGLARRLGATVARIDIDWSVFEWRAPGRRNWYGPQVQKLDRFLDVAQRDHLAVIATVMNAPCWASVRAGEECPRDLSQYTSTHPPLDPRTYATFLQRLIAHVGRKIGFYEVWNEPDLPRFWSHPSPAQYVRLLRTAYAAVKEVAPWATVLAGATSGSDVSFINRMYDLGAAKYFDALSIHPYSGDRPAQACKPARQSFRCGVQDVRAAMVRHGDRGPLWLTELGTEVEGRVTAAGQAAYVKQAFTLVRGWKYVRGALWYELYDDPTEHDGQHYGLYTGTLRARLSALAFQSAAHHR